MPVSLDVLLFIGLDAEDNDLMWPFQRNIIYDLAPATPNLAKLKRRFSILVIDDDPAAFPEVSALIPHYSPLLVDFAIEPSFHRVNREAS